MLQIGDKIKEKTGAFCCQVCFLLVFLSVPGVTASGNIILHTVTGY